MTQYVQAIFEHGVFRPLEPIELHERQQVSLVVSEVVAPLENAAAAAEQAALALQRDALAVLRKKMDSLPDRAPLDGLGGADHDRILYGTPE